MRGLVPVFDKDTNELLMVVDNLTHDQVEKIANDVTAIWREADGKNEWFDAVNDDERGLKVRLEAEGGVVYDISSEEVYF